MPPLKNDQKTTTKESSQTDSKPLKKSTRSTSRPKTKEEIIARALSFVDLESVSKDTKYKFTLIDDLGKLYEACNDFIEINPDVIAVDTETQGLKWEHNIIGVSFSFSENHNYYIPFRHDSDAHQLDIEDCRDVLNSIFSHKDKTYVFHNYKFDYHKLYKDGIYVGGKVHDTMLMHYVLNENESHALKNLATDFVDPNAHHYESVISDIRRRLARGFKIKIREFGYEHIPIDIMVQYACRDTFYTLKLFEIFSAMLIEDPDLNSAYQRELDLLPVLCDMESFGVYVNQDLLEERSVELGKNVEQIRKEVIDLAGCEFDLNSPSQLSAVLQEKGIHTFKYTPKGKMSTDVKALRGISSRFPFIKKLLEFRENYKIKYSYTDPLQAYCDENSYIHCSYLQAVAVTGRLTCKSPSLQVIPRSAGIRDAFVVPSDDFIIVPIDLSQVELRMAAHYSSDPILLHAYTHGEDIHSRTAAEIFDVDISEVEKSQRTIAKPINFGIIYGIGPGKLSETLDIPQDEARRYIDRYLESYAGVAGFIKKYKRLAKKHGYVKNYFGRIRHLSHLLDPDIEEWQRERGYRQAVNFVIQSSCADMFKIILVRCHKLLKDMKSKMVMNIHDEIVFYIHVDEIDIVADIKRCFEDWHFKVPMVADVSFSNVSWGAKQSLEL